MIKIFTYKYFTASLLLLILFWGPDIYDRDAAVDKAIQALPPSSLK